MTDQVAPDLAVLSLEQKRALLAKLMQKKASAVRKAPVSFTQKRLWLLEQIDPGNTAYHIPTLLRLTGVLDRAAVQKAFDEIVRRHETLRTTFEPTEGDPVQVIQPPAPNPLPVHEAAGLSDAALTEQVQAEVLRPFDLGRGPLFRTCLFRGSEREHLLLIVTHHIVSDGWSVGVLIREMSALYKAFAAGGDSPLPELPIQYADYAAWQRQQLSGPRLDELLAYWKERLADLPTLEIATDKPRPAVQGSAGARQTLDLPPDLKAGLDRVCQRESVTPFMLYLAAFQTLLHRYSGQDDVVVGAPIANRPRSEVEGLIGFFANTVVLRSDLSGQPTFRELLARVRRTSTEAFAHQDMPFERLVEELHPPRDPSRNPLFQVSITMQNTPRDKVQLPGLEMARQHRDVKTAMFDLSLDILRARTQPRLVFEYSTDLFETETIKRLVAHFQTLLEGIAANPDARLGELPLLTPGERRQLLEEWSGRESDFPTQSCVHELIAEQVRLRPSAVAVVFEGQSLTYAALDARANRLAHYLRRHGVGPDKAVGICLERSLDMVVAVLGVLKAGGAYVPLNPEHALERLKFVLQNAGAVLTLSHSSLRARLGDLGVPTVGVDDSALALEREPETCPGVTVSGADLAYILYTSGSTGEPKGVMASHASLLNAWHAWDEAYRLTEWKPAYLQLANFTFDVWPGDFVRALCSGGKLVLCPHETVLEADQLLALIEREKVDAIEIVPVVVRNLMSYLETMGRRLDHVRLLVVGADIWHARDHEKLKHLVGPQTRVLNSYGITEATIDSSYFEGDVANLPPDAVVPIGKPFVNTRFYVLDKHLAPVPVGVPGELHIGGPGLARGYVGRPDLTEQRFIPNPFAASAAARLYKTGDLARWRGDGAVEFLGRIDHQVKIRGFRIELGEIEAVLGRHPGVRQAVVLARSDGPGEKLLAAYVVSNGAPVSVNDLRAFAAKSLPDYMVPAALVFLDSFPLTPSGKLDRKAFPAPTTERPELDESYAEPATVVEQELARVWAEVLRRDRVGLHDNFFALGGDSILAIQVVSRARRAGLNLTPRQLFLHQTVAELAAVATTAGASGAEQGLVSGTAPLTPVQRWFFEQELPYPHHYNQGLLLKARQRLDLAKLQEALGFLLRHHDALRLRFSRQADGWRQEFSAEQAVEPVWQVVDLSNVNESEQAAAVTAAATKIHASLDLSSGPLTRLVYFEMGQGRPGRLLWVIHHLAVDGVSWRVLLEDLCTVYEQLGAGQPPALPAKTTSFKGWSELLERAARSPGLAAEAAYWLDDSRSKVASLPLDEPAGRGGPAGYVESTLEEKETTALLIDAPKAYRARIDEALLAGLARALADWTGREELLVDLEGHGREPELLAEWLGKESSTAVDLSRTVGWFTSIYPVLLRVDGPGPGDDLRAVKEQLRKTPRNGLGYGLLRHGGGAPDVSKRLKALPAASILFNYLGQLDGALGDDGPLGPAPESSGPSQDPRHRLSHALEINAGVRGGRLRLRWTYDAGAFRRETVERLAGSVREALRKLAAHCQDPEAGGFTPSDFPLADLSAEDLAAMTSAMENVNEIE